MYTDKFADRHIGPDQEQVKKMLAKVGVNTIDELIDQTIPESIRLKKPLKVDEAVSEFQYLKNLKKIASKNKVFRSYIGLGYSGTIIPSVNLRNVLENPGWYTAYTPYQAEISQGRLEALLNFQTAVIDLTGMPIANASLLDEATAAAEAMAMLFNSRSRESQKRDANIFFVSNDVYPQTIDLLKTRSTPLGITLEIGDWKTLEFSGKIFGALIQYPNIDGNANDYSDFVKRAKANDSSVAVATDLLALTLLTPPGEWGADVVFGNSQRFGVPMGYGGPHAAFFAAKEDHKRLLPGRIIGVSIDAQGNPALRMALQTREQHIRRDKATSNICTAQALLAIMASMYAVYHGPNGLKGIAEQVNLSATALANELKKLGCTIENEIYFDTIRVKLPSGINTKQIEAIALKNEINFRYINDHSLSIALDQTAGADDLNDIVAVFASAMNKTAEKISNDSINHQTSTINHSSL